MHLLHVVLLDSSLKCKLVVSCMGVTSHKNDMVVSSGHCSGKRYDRFLCTGLRGRDRYAVLVFDFFHTGILDEVGSLLMVS